VCVKTHRKRQVSNKKTDSPSNLHISTRLCCARESYLYPDRTLVVTAIGFSYRQVSYKTTAPRNVAGVTAMWQPFNHIVTMLLKVYPRTKPFPLHLYVCVLQMSKPGQIYTDTSPDKHSHYTGWLSLVDRCDTDEWVSLIGATHLTQVTNNDHCCLPQGGSA